MSFRSDIDRLARLAMKLTAEKCISHVLDAYATGDDDAIQFALYDYDLDTTAVLHRELVITRR